MSKKNHSLEAHTPAPDGELFERVVTILEEARSAVVRSVNSQMLLAYWHIGREIVETTQEGDERAEYGTGIVDDLSERLTNRYGRGFSTTNLWYFRQFYLTYASRRPEIRHKACGESAEPTSPAPPPALAVALQSPEVIDGFSPRLSWSHYRTLAKAEDRSARLFYEIEAEKEAWSVPQSARSTLFFLPACRIEWAKIPDAVRKIGDCADDRLRDSVPE